MVSRASDLGRGYRLGHTQVRQDNPDPRDDTVVITTGGQSLRLDGGQRVWRSSMPLATTDARRFRAHLATLSALDRSSRLAPVTDGGVDQAGFGWFAVAAGAETVTDWLAGDAPVSTHTVGFLAGSLAPALDALHAAGLTGEPTPDRILLDDHGDVLLVPPPPAELVEPDPAYAAPERLQGADPAPAGDSYALAALVFALLAGRPPYGTGTAAALRALTEPPPELDRRDVPVQVADLLSRGLARDPAGRPGAADLARSLAAALARPADPSADLSAEPSGPGAPMDSNPPVAGRPGSELETLPPTAAGTPGSPEPTAERPGRPLGSGYLLDELIGAGATGRVWRGRRRADGAAVAVKVLRAEFSLEPDAVVRFLRERTTLRGIDHPHVVRVHDLVAEGDTMAVVMDLVDGQDLRKAMRGLSAGDALEVLAQTCAALAAVHAAGVVHRDVKPENVLVSAGPFARLTDFGLAWVSSGPVLTRSSQLVGTPAYVAPELVAGRRAGPASDIYAVGVMAYELLAGERPFAAPSTAALLRAHLDTPPVRPDRMADPLWDLISRCLAKDPDQRPAATELATAFPALHQEQPSAPRLGWAPPDESARVSHIPAPPPDQSADASALMSLPSTTSRPGPPGAAQPTTGATRPEPPEPAPETPRRRRKPLIAGIVICALLGSAVGLWIGRPKDEPQSTTPSTPQQAPLQEYVLPVVATSPKRGVVTLQFPDYDDQPGFSLYVIWRDTTVLPQVGPNQGVPPYVYAGIDSTERHCYRVVALLETDRPQSGPKPKAACVVANGKPQR